MASPEARDLHPDEPITQYGRLTDVPRFRRRPRFEANPPEYELSVIVGHLSVE